MRASRTTGDEEASRARDLATFYDQQAEDRSRRGVGVERSRRRTEFAATLAREGRSSVVELGTGPGHDALALTQAGLRVSGVDLSGRHAAMCRDRGIVACVGSATALPFATGGFEAAWTMSTLLHVPDERVDDALAEIVRVCRPGSPVAVGVWGGHDGQGPRPQDDFDPPRYFCFRSHERWQTILARHGTVEEFATWSPRDDSFDYQWAVLRTPG